MYQKQTPYRNKKILDSARGETCTLMLPGICNGNPETTVFAHSHETGDRHGTQKADDWCGCDACSDCHNVYDMKDHRWKQIGSIALSEAFHRAMKITLRRLFRKGILK